MAKKKLKLEILDATGVVIRTHHFFYEAETGLGLKLTVDENTYDMWCDGRLKEPAFPKSADEVWATEFKPKIVLDNSGSKPPVYQNPETGKLDTLFNEDNLIPTWTVKYEDPTTGNKGEAVYITVSAETEWEAKTQALGTGEFTKHLTPEFWELKYLSAYKASGNYKIGEVQYFEGDPRL